MKKIFVLALACATFVPVAFAAGPWDGTWKIDVSKSHFEGTSFTYSKAANGMWKFTASSAVSYEFAPDGKDYKTIDAEDTVATTAKGDHELMFVNKHKDTVLSTVDEWLSPDGKTLTDHISGTKPDGTSFKDTAVMTRVGEGKGFLGTWKSTKVTDNAPGDFIISTKPDGVITWDIPDYKNTVTGKADGTPLPIQGPTVPPGLTLTLKSNGPKMLSYWVKMNGKLLNEGHMTVSADGKWLTDTSWQVGRESEKTIGVYSKD